MEVRFAFISRFDRKHKTGSPQGHTNNRPLVLELRGIQGNHIIQILFPAKPINLTLFLKPIWFFRAMQPTAGRTELMRFRHKAGIVQEAASCMTRASNQPFQPLSDQRQVLVCLCAAYVNASHIS